MFMCLWATSKDRKVLNRGAQGFVVSIQGYGRDSDVSSCKFNYVEVQGA